MTDVAVIKVLNTTILCERCRPGYKTSQLCLKNFRRHSFKRIKPEQINSSYATNSLNVSHCAACELGEFSDSFLVNQTCKKCKQCGTGFVEERKCNARSDTKCKTLANHSGLKSTHIHSLKQRLFANRYASLNEETVAARSCSEKSRML